MKVLRSIYTCAAVCLTAFMLSACGSARGNGTSLVLTANAEGTTPDGEDDAACGSEIPGADKIAGNYGNSAVTTDAGTMDQAGVPDAGVKALHETIVVHVCGAVNREGVYTLDEGSRVYEAVAAAGGFSSDADEAYINQAQILSDGVRLRIPSVEETASVLSEGDTAGAFETDRTGSGIEVITGSDKEDPRSETGMGGKININTADAETLCKLNGVGPATAAKIVAYRELNGGFKAIEDIMLVSGIKEKLFAKIKDDITV